MDEEQLKATIGETAFNAMSAEQKTALLGKFSKPKEELKPKAKASATEVDDEEDDESDLRSKAKKGREDQEKQKSENKRIENAMRFNLGVSDFVTQHKDFLPNEIQEILKVADLEKYDSAAEKANALKTAFIQSFFSIQSNADLLTASQKATIDDYFKLTKNGKESKAEQIYENILEPALETLKKVKKAEELAKARAGYSSSTKVEEGYKQRLIAGSKKSYLGEKGAN